MQKVTRRAVQYSNRLKRETRFSTEKIMYALTINFPSLNQEQIKTIVVGA